VRLAYECAARRKPETGATFQLARLRAYEKVRLHDEKTGRAISSSRDTHISLHWLRVVAAAGGYDGAA
jgi:hypothetical protein